MKPGVEARDIVSYDILIRATHSPHPSSKAAG